MRVSVGQGKSAYPVIVTGDHPEQLRNLVNREIGGARLFLFFDANVYALHGRAVARSLGLKPSRVREFVIPSGEKYKRARTLYGIYEFLLSSGITRSDFVLACGGGVTSDLVGYAAATILRGVRWGIVSTTLLGMVDASIGGKTGINHRLGKNLVGAFWSPSFVFSDTSFLSTLPEREFAAGLGEVAKTAGLAGAKEVGLLERYLDGDGPTESALARLIAACARFKADVVTRDEREQGHRMILNFGHTFGHGIEQALGYGRLLHGEAVILGLDAALGLGERLGYGSRGLADYRGLVTRLMRAVPRRRIDRRDVIQAMALDKKRSAADQRYVVLKGVGRPFVCEGIDPGTVNDALKETLERYRKVGGDRV